MTPLLHALNTGTLAAWLSVAGAGVAGLLIPEWRDVPAPVAEHPTAIEWKEPEIQLDTAPAPEPEPAPPSASAEVADPLPAPPEMPDMAESEPLPEIPELPAPPPEPAAKPISAEPRPTPAPAPTRAAPPVRRANPPARADGPSNSARTTSGASAASESSRLAAGRMPAPSYPSESRRKGQTGTVIVEFTVDGSGRVIAAFAKSPSPWPLLNEEAVRTVRRWRFPPGGVMKLQRPIVFQLR